MSFYLDMVFLAYLPDTHSTSQKNVGCLFVKLSLNSQCLTKRILSNKL